MAKKQKRSPIIEALCEFKFIIDKELDYTIPGIIYERVRDEFPEKKQQVGIGMKFKSTKKGIVHHMEQTPPRSQFFRKDKKALLQIAPDLLVVNKLKPYSSWKDFKGMIMKHYDIYNSVVNPKAIASVGLRYINQIDIGAKNESVELEDYFCFYPHTPSSLSDMTNFITRVEVPYSDKRDRLLLTLSSAPEGAFILDLDYVMPKEGGVELDDVDQWIEMAHATIKENFEACIGDRCREFMEGSK